MFKHTVFILSCFIVILTADVLHAQVLPSTLFVSNVSYSAAGAITQINYGNGNITTYTYNDLNLRLNRIKTVNSGSQTIQDLNYTYDALGNILSIVDNINTANQSFQYDHLNRLTQAVGQQYATKNYSYNAIGNITSKDALSYTYDGIAGGPHAVTGLSDGTTFTYDDNGNMLTMQKASDLTQYIYDVENRLLEVKENSQSQATYAYDGDGGRTKKSPTGTTPVTKFIGEMFEEQGTRQTSYIFLGGQRIASITNGAVLYFHGDHLGSANLVTSSTGVLKELSEYEPYGKFSKHEKYGDPDEEAWYYFTNQYLDEESELYYYGARYYSPLIGRFIQADTIVGYPSNPQSFNRYSYVHNNPVNLVDPTGNFAWFIPFIVAAFKGALIGAAVGAGVAAVTGGDIGRGALFGAIGGAVFAGLSSGFTSLAKFAMTGTTNVSLIGGAATTVNILGGIVGGAGAGAAGAAFLGTDIGNGAGIGALSGGLFGGISQMPGAGWAGVGKIALAGAAGGAISEIVGGTFREGFIFAASVASADFIYRAILRSDGHDLPASLGRMASEKGQPRENDNYATPRNININTVGWASKSDGAMSSLWEKFFTFIGGETGPVMSRVGMSVPGAQSFGLGHDITGRFLTKAVGARANSLLFNFTTMPPLYGLNLAGSIINDNPAFIGIYEANKEDR